MSFRREWRRGPYAGGNKMLIVPRRRTASFEQLLLDVYPGAAFAYDLQQLKTGVTNVVDVRRSSDNTVLAFTAQQIVDGTLLSWVGTGNNGLVTRMYDQTGNNRHATQTAPANQPQIVVSGALVTTNGKPALRCNGSQRMDIPTVPFSMNNFYVHTVSRVNTTANQVAFSCPGDNRIYAPIIDGGAYYGGYMANALAFNFGSAGVTNQYLMQINAGTSLCNAWRNNIASTAVASSSAAEAGNNLSIGSYEKDGVLASWWNGFISGIVFYTSEQSANRAGIAAAVNALYGIY
jgi:hypothetical protein